MTARTIALVALAALTLLVLLSLVWPDKRDPADGVPGMESTPVAAPAPTATPAPVSRAVSADVQQQAIERFRDQPGIRHTEWLDGDFIMAAMDNDKSWQSVADATCVWIRSRGAPEGFAVVVLEAAALQNKRWLQLARARCN